MLYVVAPVHVLHSASRVLIIDYANLLFVVFNSDHIVFALFHYICNLCRHCPIFSLTQRIGLQMLRNRNLKHRNANFSKMHIWCPIIYSHWWAVEHHTLYSIFSYFSQNDKIGIFKIFLVLLGYLCADFEGNEKP